MNGGDLGPKFRDMHLNKTCHAKKNSNKIDIRYFYLHDFYNAKNISLKFIVLYFSLTTTVVVSRDRSNKYRKQQTTNSNRFMAPKQKDTLSFL